MAFGIGKAFKKTWKDTLGKAEDVVKPVAGTVIGTTIGSMIGLPQIGFAVGSTYDAAANARRSEKKQERLVNAQIASAEKIANMQNMQVTASATPTMQIEQEQMAADNAATSKRRAFRFAKTTRGNTTLG